MAVRRRVGNLLGRRMPPEVTRFSNANLAELRGERRRAIAR